MVQYGISFTVDDVSAFRTAHIHDLINSQPLNDHGRRHVTRKLLRDVRSLHKPRGAGSNTVMIIDSHEGVITEGSGLLKYTGEEMGFTRDEWDFLTQNVAYNPYTLSAGRNLRYHPDRARTPRVRTPNTPVKRRGSARSSVAKKSRSANTPRRSTRAREANISLEITDDLDFKTPTRSSRSRKRLQSSKSVKSDTRSKKNKTRVQKTKASIETQGSSPEGPPVFNHFANTLPSFLAQPNDDPVPYPAGREYYTSDVFGLNSDDHVSQDVNDSQFWSLSHNEQQTLLSLRQGDNDFPRQHAIPQHRGYGSSGNEHAFGHIAPSHHSHNSATVALASTSGVWYTSADNTNHDLGQHSAHNYNHGHHYASPPSPHQDDEPDVDILSILTQEIEDMQRTLASTNEASVAPPNTAPSTANTPTEQMTLPSMATASLNVPKHEHEGVIFAADGQVFGHEDSEALEVASQEANNGDTFSDFKEDDFERATEQWCDFR